MLFVGEALVGNEAVDQLTRFNQALADHSPSRDNPHLIDGMVLSKFDTIDDKVCWDFFFHIACVSTEMSLLHIIYYALYFSKLLKGIFSPRLFESEPLLTTLMWWSYFPQVGSAISMTYITGQPILFVGTGQTYTDLKSLNSKAVVQALMK